MKKIILASLSFLFVFLTSCNKDEEEENTSNSDSIVGKWRLDYYTPFTEDAIIYSIEDCEKESIYEYKEDGTLSYEYVLDINESDTQTECAVDGEGTFNYSIDGNKLTSDGETVTFSISDNILTITNDDGSIDKYLRTTDLFFSQL